MGRCRTLVRAYLLVAALSSTGCAAGSLGSIGVRTGLFVPTGARKDAYSASLLLGAFWASDLPEINGIAIPFDAGFDLSWSKRVDDEVDASFFLAYFDCFFPPFNPSSDMNSYLLAGLRINVATGNFSGNGTTSEVVPAIDLGIGLMSFRGWDVRMTYCILMGSRNHTGLCLVTMGYCF